ncbi:hypothetical protein MBLNU13_g01200t2 [Cladosporium sp. NU13]
MAITLQHIPDLYLYALLFHRSDQRYLQLKCLERLEYLVTTQASFGNSQYSSRILSMCEVSREVDNDQLWPYFRSNPASSCKEVLKASSPLNMFFEIILAAVSVNVLKKVLEWCSQHKNDPAPTQDDDADSRKKTTDIEEWNQKFMQVYHEVVLAANFMDIKALLSVGCKTVVSTTKHKPPEEIRKTSTHGWKVGRTYHEDDADSRKTTTGIEEWQEQNRPFNLYEFQNPLLDAGCKTVANMIKGKPPEEIRKTFSIQNDFTSKEEDQIRRENEWADLRGVNSRGVTSSKKRHWEDWVMVSDENLLQRTVEEKARLCALIERLRREIFALKHNNRTLARELNGAKVDKVDSIHVVHYEEGQRREVGVFILGGTKTPVTMPISMLTGRIYVADGELSLSVLQSDTGISLQNPAFQDPFAANFNTSFGFRTVVNYPQERSCYNASKTGVVQLTKSLTAKWARHQIRVTRSMSTPSAVPSST